MLLLKRLLSKSLSAKNNFCYFLGAGIILVVYKYMWFI